MSAYLPQELIRKKRDGGALDEAEIGFLVEGIATGTLADEQVGAFAMAVFLNGMDMEERIALTRAMAGSVLDWRGLGLDRPAVDKHSTGGVGDKVSLMLAPMVAACGGAVPMISGRGLGHTGGTLDKLEAIPGYDAKPDIARFAEVVKQVGCAVIGQTAEMAPADKRLYAVRDVTATVESIPLITASILSKKLAAGLDALVMDVKFGNGAFMAERERARELAQSIVTVANGAGLPTRAVLTDMSQVLGWTAGNAVEVQEAADYLTGARREPRLHAVTMALSAEMLVQAGLASDPGAAETALVKALDSGAAAERFGQMVAALGGPKDFLKAPQRHLPTASVTIAIMPARPGFVETMATRDIGLAVVALGGGRTRASDPVDPRVGFTEFVQIGDAVGPNRPLALCHAADQASAERAAAQVQAAIGISDEAPDLTPAIAERF